MEISKEDIGRYAGNLLRVLDKQGIDNVAAVTLRNGQKYMVDKKGSQVIVEARPSMSGTVADTLAYVLTEKHIPIEIRFNEPLGFSSIILKCQDRLSGYTSFARDIFENMAQDRVFESCNFELVKEELDRLRMLQQS